MHSARRSLWSIFLLVVVIVACSPTVPSEPNLASAPTAVSGLRMSPVPSSAALMAAPTLTSAVPSAAPGAEASQPGWHQLGRLVAGSADGPTIAALAIDPSAPTTLYAGTLYTADNHIGVYRSGDAGATWQPTGQGLPITTDGTGVESLAIDPQHTNTLYASGHFDGIWRSDDRGESWHATGPKGGSVGALALDPRVSGTLYALTGDGPQRSTDGGATWLPLGVGLPDHTSVAFTSLLIDPQQPDTLYLGASFGGVFRSSDSGQHWSAVNSGLPDQPVLDGLALDRLHSGTLYITVTGAGLYRSADGSQRWEQASNQEYDAITPVAGDTLYALLNDTLARSTDRGKTWRVVADVACGVQTLTATPSGRVAVGCSEGQLYALQSAQPNASPAAASSTQPPLPMPTADLAVTAPTTAAAPVSADARDAVLKAARMLAQAGPYHVAGTLVDNGTTIQLTSDVVPPDRAHYTMNTPNGVVEFITIGDQSYTKAKGKWIATPVGGNDMQSAAPLSEAFMQNSTDVTLTGSDTVNDVAAQVYAYITHLDDQVIAVKLWVGTADGLPLKIESDSQHGSQTLHGSETVTYDPSITINAPIK